MDSRRQIGRSAALWLIAIAPALLLAAGVVRFMLNHMFFHAPYLLDTGMLSGLVYRDGLVLPTPQIACNYATVFYDVYVSPLMSLFSALSYVAPVGRLDWFALVQGAVYAPTGLAVYVVASRLEPDSLLRRLPITLFAALAFSFSGIVLWMIGYPHFEAAIPALTCLTLGALVTGRPRMAWLCLVVAASVRQDGGAHVAIALVPLVVLRWRGVAMAPSRRRLVAMICAGIGACIAGTLCQKLLFHPAGRLASVYLGIPPYAHLGASMLAARLRRFVEVDQVIYYPLLATCLVAAIRRDARYLLGWASVAPWFAFNLTAYDDAKAMFFAYADGPFLVGIFWVYVYGAHLAPAHRRLRAAPLEAVLGLVCVASTLGVQRSNSPAMRQLVEDMAVVHRIDRAAVRGFVDALRDRRARFGRLRADGAIATLALEVLEPSEIWGPGATGVDTLAFHRELADAVVPDLIANQLDACTQVRGTGIVVCAHDRLRDAFAGVATDELPATFLATSLGARYRNIVAADDRGVVFRNRHALGGTLGVLPPGSYVWTVRLAVDEPVELDGDQLATLEIERDGARMAFASAARNERELRLRFDVDRRTTPILFNFMSRAATPLTVTATQIRRLPTGTTAPP